MKFAFVVFGDHGFLPCSSSVTEKSPVVSMFLWSAWWQPMCCPRRVRPIWCALRCRWVGIKLANRMLSHHMDACSRQMGHSDIQRSLRKTSAPVKMAMATDSLETCRLPLDHRRHRIVDFELNRWQVRVQRRKRRVVDPANNVTPKWKTVQRCQATAVSSIFQRQPRKLR